MTETISKILQVGRCKSSASLLHSETKKSEKFFDGIKTIRNAKVIKRSPPCEFYAINYQVKILNSFNLLLLLKNNKPTIKHKLIDLLSEWRRFKFLTTLVLEFKKIESEDETKYSTFYLNSNP